MTRAAPGRIFRRDECSKNRGNLFKRYSRHSGLDPESPLACEIAGQAHDDSLREFSHGNTRKLAAPRRDLGLAILLSRGYNKDTTKKIYLRGYHANYSLCHAYHHRHPLGLPFGVAAPAVNDRGQPFWSCRGRGEAEYLI